MRYDYLDIADYIAEHERVLSCGEKVGVSYDELVKAIPRHRVRTYVSRGLEQLQARGIIVKCNNGLYELDEG